MTSKWGWQNVSAYRFKGYLQQNKHKSIIINGLQVINPLALVGKFGTNRGCMAVFSYNHGFFLQSPGCLKPRPPLRKRGHPSKQGMSVLPLRPTGDGGVLFVPAVSWMDYDRWRKSVADTNPSALHWAAEIQPNIGRDRFQNWRITRSSRSRPSEVKAKSLNLTGLDINQKITV